MIVPYSLVIIKPLSVGRGDGPTIITDLLDNLPITIRSMSELKICETSWLALSKDKGPHASTLDFETHKIHAGRTFPSWIMVVTHMHRHINPTEMLNEYCGPIDHAKWLPDHLRFRFNRSANRKLDDVIHISKPERAKYEADILITDFDPEQI